MQAPLGFIELSLLYQGRYARQLGALRGRALRQTEQRNARTYKNARPRKNLPAHSAEWHSRKELILAKAQRNPLSANLSRLQRNRLAS
jgi:hypothetical protein